MRLVEPVLKQESLHVLLRKILSHSYPHNPHFFSFDMINMIHFVSNPLMPCVPLIGHRQHAPSDRVLHCSYTKNGYAKSK